MKKETVSKLVGGQEEIYAEAVSLRNHEKSAEVMAENYFNAYLDNFILISEFSRVGHF